MNPQHESGVIPSSTSEPASAPALSRALANRHVTMISIGGIIGAALFVGSSTAIANIGPAVVLSYLLAGVMILLVMRMLAEMASVLPGTRSFTDFARAGLGDCAGFVTGWLYWYFWVIVVPIEAIAGAVLLHGWLALPVWVLGGVLILIMTSVNLMSARSYGEFEFWFASIKISAIVLFIALGAAYVFGLMGHHPPLLRNLYAFGGFMPHGPLAVLSGVSTVFFLLTGAEITTVAAVESRDPGRALTKLTTTVMSRIMSFYVLSTLLIVTVVPWTLIVPGESPFTHALRTMHFQSAGIVMSIVILTAVLSCLNSAFYVTSRVLFTLAGHSEAPRWLVRLNRRRVPAYSVLIGCAAGLAGVSVATWAPGPVFSFLVNASGALMVFVYMLTAFAQIRVRRQLAGRTPPVKMWWFPWSSYAVIAGMVLVLIAMALSPGMASQLYASVGALVVAAAAYLLRARYRRRVADAASLAVANPAD
jgi:GABA permease